MSTIDQQIASLREAVGAASDAHLAEMLGYSRAAVSHWRRRGSVPRKAKSRAEAMARHADSARAALDRRVQLGGQLLFEGRCLALFLSPSFDAFLQRRFGPTNYVGALREYAGLFDDIELACAEAIECRLAKIEGNASDAFDALTMDDREDLLARIIERAKWWRFGEGPSSTLHEPRVEFRGKDDAG